MIRWEISEDKHILYLGSPSTPLYFALQGHDNVITQETFRQEEKENFDTVLSDTMGQIANRIERERVLIEVNKALKDKGRIVLCDKINRIQEYAEMLNQMQWNDIEIEQNSYTTFVPYAILTAHKPGTITE